MDEQIKADLEEHPPQTEAHVQAEDRTIIDLDKRIDTIEARLASVEQAISALDMAVLAVLIEAAKEIQTEDNRPKSNSIWYKPVFGKRD